MEIKITLWNNIMVSVIVLLAYITVQFVILCPKQEPKARKCQLLFFSLASSQFSEITGMSSST